MFQHLLESGLALLKGNAGVDSEPPKPPGSMLLRRLVTLLARKGRGMYEICECLTVSPDTVACIVEHSALVSPHNRPTRVYKSDRYWSPTQKQLLLQSWPAELAIEQICAEIGRDRSKVLAKARSFGLRVRERRALQDLAAETVDPVSLEQHAFHKVDAAAAEVVSALPVTLDANEMSLPRQVKKDKRDKALEKRKVSKRKKTDSTNLAASRPATKLKRTSTAYTLGTILPSLFPMQEITVDPKTAKVKRKRVKWTEEMEAAGFTHFDHGLTSAAAGLVMGLSESAVRSYWSKMGLAGRKRNEIWDGEGPSPVRGAARHLVQRRDEHTLTMFWCRKEDARFNWFSPATRRSKWAKENNIPKKFG